MRQYPKDTDDQAKLTQLNAKPWQSDLLRLNPPYVYWGNDEGYMAKEGDHGWDTPLTYPTWKECNFSLDDLNECVHFYFELYRANHECEACEGTGYNPATKELSESFYAFNGGIKWSNKITQDEVVALIKGGRLNEFAKPTTTLDGKSAVTRYQFDEEKNAWYGWVHNEKYPTGKKLRVKEPAEYPTAQEVNLAQSTRARGHFGHDAINRWILIDTRAKRLGVYGTCDECNGFGYVYDEPEAKVALQMWILHPRKGASRGVRVENITEQDLPLVFNYLRKAAARNARRFNKIPVVMKSGQIFGRKYNTLF